MLPARALQMKPHAAGGGGGVWTTVFTGSSTSTSTGWSGWAMRQKIPASVITDATGTQVRLTIRSTGSTGIVVGECWFGLKGVGDWDFTGTQVQVTFNSGSTTASVGINTDLVTDPITFAYSGTADLEIFYFFSGATSWTSYDGGGGASMVNGQKNANDHGTTTATGYSTTIAHNALKLIETLV